MRPINIFSSNNITFATHVLTKHVHGLSFLGDEKKGKPTVRRQLGESRRQFFRRTIYI